MSPLAHILQYKFVAILRGITPKEVLSVANALHDGGIRILEVTLNSDDALAQIETLTHTIGNKMLIGAGTVLNAVDAKAAIQAGAAFLISPVVDVDVITLAKDHDLVSIPGAFTPTEIVQAHRSGGDIIKVFPVTDPAYFKALRAPLNHIRMMPTGGVALNTVNAFKQAGAAAFGVGSALVPAAPVDERYLTNLTKRAHSFIKAIQD